MSAARRPGLPRVAIAAPLALAVLVALLWSVGFALFVRAAMREPPPPPRADGIVALTGGAGRVETALRLLAEGQAEQLLISGVGAAESRSFAQRAGVDPGLGRRVTLGRGAATTRGNASETADLARGKKIRSLILATTGYHMPRALAEFGRALPDVALYPVPVQPRAGGEAAMLRLLASEYTKFLAAEVGLSAVDPRAAIRSEHGANAEHGG